MRWSVPAEESGMKLLTFIAHRLPKSSQKQLKRLLDAGRCRINGRVERFASHPVGRGDQIEFDEVPVGGTVDGLEDPRRILYSDDAIVAYDKPSGISSEDSKLVSAVRKKFPTAILLHRLDKETSGVLLFALTESAATAMLTLFKLRKIDKTYLAIVDGIPRQASGRVENFLGKRHEYQGQTIWGAVPREKGKSARTAWRVKKKYRESALVECFPETGRTHQIRIHMSDLGHPILGDDQYGRIFHCSYRPQRLLLHASGVSFVHPITRQQIAIVAETPPDFINIE